MPLNSLAEHIPGFECSVIAGLSSGSLCSNVDVNGMFGFSSNAKFYLKKSECSKFQLTSGSPSGPANDQVLRSCPDGSRCNV